MTERALSPSPAEITQHYASGYEAQRLANGTGNLERVRTRELIVQFAPKPPAKVLDVGGGTGEHACWLATQGYHVHLVDLVPLHVEMALRASQALPDTRLASATVGDARSLDAPTGEFDCVLLLGPLYHLTSRADRRRALREAYRVLVPGGVLLAAAIARFASALDGLNRGLFEDPVFAAIVTRDLEDGQHTNPSDKAEYFMQTFFHHPDELAAEVGEAGFELYNVCAIEGISWLARDFDRWWLDAQHRERLLGLSRQLQNEPSLLGVSPHIMGIARRPGPA